MENSTTFNLKVPEALVVDDDKIALVVTQAMLANMGCHVVTASSGMEALEILEKQTFNFILMDINMPRLDGLDVTKIIRASNNSTKNIPIIGFTAHQDKEILNKAKKAGMNEIFIKPVSPSAFKTFISNLIA